MLGQKQSFPTFTARSGHRHNTHSEQVLALTGCTETKEGGVTGTLGQVWMWSEPLTLWKAAAVTAIRHPSVSHCAGQHQRSQA